MGFTKNGLHLTRFLFIEAILPHILYDIDRLGFTLAASCIRGRPSVVLFGWDDFKPFHGSGSGESKAFQEEQWQLQQDKIRERSNKGLTKDKLKKKYQNKNVQLKLSRCSCLRRAQRARRRLVKESRRSSGVCVAI